MKKIGRNPTALVAMDDARADFDACFGKRENNMLRIDAVEFRLDHQQLLVLGYMQALKAIRFEELVAFEWLGPSTHQPFIAARLRIGFECKGTVVVAVFEDDPYRLIPEVEIVEFVDQMAPADLFLGKGNVQKRVKML